MISYRFEYCGNPEFVELHVTTKLTDEEYSVSNQGFKQESEYCKQDRFKLGVFNSVEGVIELRFSKYSVVAKRGSAFERDDILNGLFEVIKMLFPQDEFKQLPTLRNDINFHKCSQCIEEQNKEIRETMKEFDSLDY